ncbi:ABC transporter [Planomonospora parontospora subsp. parontospora]|uniref:ABC transporter n=2 Tax=Planomonospora parontospora TaxID=58119 RepID=A0AA37BJQ4_9ACTN|nr:ABC transporter permease [Planomonospora parontospora]GGK81252.1 ABC transporter [Planomonospora parontospora]GII11784.1 ABC transporter [Planomonospora parontospora subsp. parontospora]
MSTPADAVRAAIAAEWVKLRTVRSTFWLLLLAFALSVGLAHLIGLTFADMKPDPERPFDPLFAAFYSLTLGQLPLVAFGVLVMGGEYSSGTIRPSLAAVPRRGLFYGGKLLAEVPLLLGFSLVTVPVAFLVSQAALGPQGVSVGADGAVEAMIGASLYLTLITLFSTGVATMLRGSALSLGVLLPLLFLGSQGLGNIPKVKTVTQFLPDQVGMVVMHLTGPPGDPRFGRPYGPWTGMALLALWTAAALLGGHLALRRRDA